MKRAPKRWQIFSQEIVILPWVRQESEGEMFRWASLPVFSRRLKPATRGLVFEQLFGHFLVAEALDFCADGG